MSVNMPQSIRHCSNMWNYGKKERNLTMQTPTRYKKLSLAAAAVLYGAAFLLLACYFYMEFGGSYRLTPGSRVAMLLLSCLLMYPGGILLSRRIGGKRRDKPLRANLFLWLVLYLVLFATLTLFDLHFARSGLRFAAWDREKLNQYFQYSFNMVPFSTILSYFRGFFQGETSRYVFAYNIFGNMAALMPLGFFLPLLFPRQQRWRVFVPTVAGVVAAIELLQFAGLTGSCDIDDLILNVSGACLMFALLEKTPLRRLVRRIFLLEGAGGTRI